MNYMTFHATHKISAITERGSYMARDNLVPVSSVKTAGQNMGEPPRPEIGPSRSESEKPSPLDKYFSRYSIDLNRRFNYEDSLGFYQRYSLSRLDQKVGLDSVQETEEEPPPESSWQPAPIDEVSKLQYDVLKMPRRFPIGVFACVARNKALILNDDMDPVRVDHAEYFLANSEIVWPFSESKRPGSGTNAFVGVFLYLTFE